MATRSRSTRPGTRPNAAEYDAQTLQSWINGNTRHAAVPRARRRSRPGRSSAPSRASCRCSSCSSTSPRRATSRTRHVRAQLQHPRRRADVPLPRRLAADLQADGEAARPRAVVLRPPGEADHPGPRRRRRCAPKRLDVEAKRVIVAIPPVAGRARSTTSPVLPDRARPADRALPAGDADQGRRASTTAVLARRRPERAGALDRGADQRDLRRLAGGRQPGRRSSASSAATQARELREALQSGAARQAVIANYASFFGAEATNPKRYFETTGRASSWTRGCPVGIPAPGTLRRLRRRPAQAGRPHPLGGDRDVDLLERLHGRRGALRRARRGGGAGPALSGVALPRPSSA